MRLLHLKRKTLNFALAMTNLFVPLIGERFIPCANDGAGEIVLFQGFLHVVEHHTFNDRFVNEKIHIQPVNVEGVGLITGDMYRGTGVTQIQDSFRLANGATHITSINNFRFIGQGPDNNFQVHETVHTTINANGEVTVTVENSNTDCN